MKDAASCDNPRLGAHTLRPAGLRMGEPARRSPGIPGARRMPWHRKPMKDAASCDNPRLGAHTLRPAGLRMGEPARRSPGIPRKNSYSGGGQPGELKHLSTRRRRNQQRDPPSSGERKGADGQTGERAGASLEEINNEIPRVAASERGPTAKPASGRAPAYTAAGVAGPPARELALPAGIHPGEPNGMGRPAAQG